MKPLSLRGLAAAFAACALVAASACVIQPQPLPPGGQPTASDAGKDQPGTVQEPPAASADGGEAGGDTSTDGGSRDAGSFGDAQGPDSGDAGDASSDAGDAAVDAGPRDAGGGG